jgi:hypothetical protein
MSVYLCTNPGCPNYVDPVSTQFCSEHSPPLEKKDLSYRFDLEQAILGCWHITDDINDIANSLEYLTPEQLSVALRGLREVYEIKFDKAFRLYEQALKKSEL